MSELRVNAVTDETGGNTATINGMTPTAQSLQGFRNRIINGDMRINQRALGTQTQSGAALQYPCDRFYTQGVASAGVYTSQISSDAPAGFNSSVLLTVTTASAPSGTQVYRIIQRIEGFNTADFNLGTANAKALTLSFWVKASVTGTFGGSLWGGAATAWFPFSYTINAANTWEQKTVSIGAATSAPSTAFDTTNGVGLQLTLNIGAGSTTLATAGSWIYGSTEYYGATGQTNLIATSGATFYLTGVQLEAGSVATPFERRPYGTELQLAQRYFIRINDPGGMGVYGGGQVSRVTFPLPVPMRSSITLTAPSTYNFYNGATVATGTASSYFPGATNQTPQVDFLVAGYTTGAAIALYTNGGSQFITASAEL